MRSYQNGKMQNFIIIGLVLLVMILGLNYFSLSRKFDDALKDNLRQQNDITKRMHEDRQRAIEKLQQEHETKFNYKKTELEESVKELEQTKKLLEEKKVSLEEKKEELEQEKVSKSQLKFCIKILKKSFIPVKE